MYVVLVCFRFNRQFVAGSSAAHPFMRICHCDELKLFYKRWLLWIPATNVQTEISRRVT